MMGKDVEGVNVSLPLLFSQANTKYFSLVKLVSVFLQNLIALSTVNQAPQPNPVPTKESIHVQTDTNIQSPRNWEMLKEELRRRYDRKIKFYLLASLGSVFILVDCHLEEKIASVTLKNFLFGCGEPWFDLRCNLRDL